MMERYVEVHAEVSSVMFGDKNSPPVLQNADLLVLTEAMAILQPFKVRFLSVFNTLKLMTSYFLFQEATVDLSAEKTATLSLVVPAVYSINQKLEELANNTTTIEAAALLTAIAKETTKRLNSLEMNRVYSAATVLDPRFKQKFFLNYKNGFAAVEAIKESLPRAVQTISKPKAPAKSRPSGMLFKTLSNKVKRQDPTLHRHRTRLIGG